jgi:hypothetical protein
MRYGEIREALRLHFEERLDALKERIGESGRLQPRYLAALAETAVWSDQAVKAGWPLSEFEPEDRLTKLIDKLKLPIEANSTDYQTFGVEYQRGIRDFSLAAIALDKELDRYTFGATQGGSVTPQARPKGVGMALQEVVRRYTAEGLLTEKWAAKTTSEKAEHFALLYELLGADHDVNSL